MSNSIISKFRNFASVIRHNGGLRSSIYQFWRVNELKEGTLVGTDKYGNKYYENPKYFYARDRWVDYNADTHLDYDASQVPPEWHRWLHHISDHPPTIEKPVTHAWMIDHEENKSGTSEKFYPYSTTRTKVHSWQPGTRSKTN